MKNTTGFVLEIFIYLLFHITTFAQNGVIYSSNNNDLMTHSEKMSCVCNDPQVRDAFKPDASTPIKNVLVRFVIVQKNSGKKAVSQSEVQTAVNFVNTELLPHKIQILAGIEFITSNKYFKIRLDEADEMKNDFPRNTDYQLAIYVVKEIKSWNYFAQSTFPWQGSQTNKIATSTQGGIIFESENFIDYDNVVHEIGHAFGLYHTHHGTTKELNCTNDPLDVENVGGNNDIRGDFCSDTEPFPWVPPADKVCSDADINSVSFPKTDCNGVTLPLTAKNNYMSYTSTYCRAQFTPQQAGRMHCFLTHYSIQGWLIGCIFDLPLLNQTTNQNQTYSVSNKIEAGPNFIISSGTDIKFSASNKIILNPGFVAQAGSHFVAEIAPCTPMRINETIDDTLYEYADIAAVIASENNNITSFATITPNPTSGKFTISIGDEDDIENINYHLEIYNTLGEKIAPSNSPKGGELNSLPSGGQPARQSHSGGGWAIDLSSHPKGIYFLKVITRGKGQGTGDEEKIYTKKIIIQ